MKTQKKNQKHRIRKTRRIGGVVHDLGELLDPKNNSTIDIEGNQQNLFKNIKKEIIPINHQIQAIINEAYVDYNKNKNKPKSRLSVSYFTNKNKGPTEEEEDKNLRGELLSKLCAINSFEKYAVIKYLTEDIPQFKEIYEQAVTFHEHIQRKITKEDYLETKKNYQASTDEILRTNAEIHMKLIYSNLEASDKIFIDLFFIVQDVPADKLQKIIRFFQKQPVKVKRTSIFDRGIFERDIFNIFQKKNKPEKEDFSDVNSEISEIEKLEIKKIDDIISVLEQIQIYKSSTPGTTPSSSTKETYCSEFNTTEIQDKIKEGIEKYDSKFSIINVFLSVTSYNNAISMIQKTLGENLTLKEIIDKLYDNSEISLNEYLSQKIKDLKNKNLEALYIVKLYFHISCKLYLILCTNYGFIRPNPLIQRETNPLTKTNLFLHQKYDDFSSLLLIVLYSMIYGKIYQTIVIELFNETCLMNYFKTKIIVMRTIFQYIIGDKEIIYREKVNTESLKDKLNAFIQENKDYIPVNEETGGGIRKKIKTRQTKKQPCASYKKYTTRKQNSSSGTILRAGRGH